MREKVLLASITELHGSVRANDAKCSAALVVHGLLFAATLGLVDKLAPVFAEAPPWQKWTVVGMVLVAALLFLFSVGFLLAALRPYRPKKLYQRDAQRPGVFFPFTKRERISEDQAWPEMRQRLNELRLENVETELAGEVTKLAFILRHESGKAMVGYFLLLGELILVILLFGFLAWMGAVPRTG
jgi:hypothetical protein